MRLETQTAEPLSARQQEVVTLVQRYVEAAHEMPSSGWLSRRLNVSPTRAKQHLATLRRKGWFER